MLKIEEPTKTLTTNLFLLGAVQCIKRLTIVVIEADSIVYYSHRNNILLFVDLVLIGPETDLSFVRTGCALAGLAILVGGLIWET